MCSERGMTVVLLYVIAANREDMESEPAHKEPVCLGLVCSGLADCTPRQRACRERGLSEITSCVMSWISRDSELQEDDWSLLRFESVKSQVFTIAKKEGVSSTHNPSLFHVALTVRKITQTPTHVELSSDEEWQQWLDQVSTWSYP